MNTKLYLLGTLSTWHSTIISGIGIQAINAWRTSALAFAGGTEVEVYGLIEMDGAYTKKGKKFTVKDGVFTLTWINSVDYGEPANKVLTGTWTLQRK